MEKNRMPALFVGHGSPMNMIEHNSFTESLVALAKKIHRPKSILVVSAHWLTEGTFFTCEEKPEQIYDFYGFPDELYSVRYEASGMPRLAAEAAGLLSEYKAGCGKWGFDHASWAVLKHMYPEADIPVVEMSIDINKQPSHHFALGKALKPLREKGVLVIGSGNIVHNLGMIKYDEDAKPFQWAVEFDQLVKDSILKKDFDSLLKYKKFGDAAAYAVPTPDHYYPMLYTLGMTDENEKIEFTHEGIQNGSVSMRGFIAG